MTFTTDIDDLIRLDRGDTKRLRNIRDVIKHDNFITSVDKKYVESLISAYLRNQSLDGSEVNIKSRTIVELKDNVKPTGRETTSSSSLFSGSNNKKLGILAGVAAAIALVVVVGFSASTDQIDITTVSDIIPSSTPQIIINVDGSSYKTADIISISGSIKSADGKSVELSIENTSGDKIWREYIDIKNNGQFSTLIIAAGFGWDDSGTYVLKAQHNELENKIKFSFSA
ncbi:MAG TPA: hypothetical protein EYO14_02960 [Candidatus Nitrosopelagicus sp.]|nr:hypothetical protein [Marine Group I thaumarchaeote]HIA97212.1 hypothetical protein [Candidatus Nitrosopelagicus sp.]